MEAERYQNMNYWDIKKKISCCLLSGNVQYLISYLHYSNYLKDSGIKIPLNGKYFIKKMINMSYYN